MKKRKSSRNGITPGPAQPPRPCWHCGATIQFVFEGMREDGERIFAWANGDGTRHACATSHARGDGWWDRRVQKHPSRVNLDVPYCEKDEAKALGARWDAELRVWYVPPGTSPGKFARWIRDVQTGYYEQAKHDAHEHMKAICAGA